MPAVIALSGNGVLNQGVRNTTLRGTRTIRLNGRNTIYLLLSYGLQKKFIVGGARSEKIFLRSAGVKKMVNRCSRRRVTTLVVPQERAD